MGQAEQVGRTGRQNRTGRKDRQNGAGRTEQAEDGLPEQVCKGKECQKRTAMTKKLVEEFKKF
jgi:hypothetical protein